jgi:cation:H+ antiporter
MQGLVTPSTPFYTAIVSLPRGPDLRMKFLYLLGGLAVLVFGAEMLVRHAAALAARLKVPPLVIGLTIVAFGTSAPELTISTLASLDGKPDIAIGNVIGSNIFNVLVVLGVSALITPLVICEQLIRIDVPVMVAVSLLALILALDGDFDLIDSVFLLGLFVAYTGLQIKLSRDAANDAADVACPPGSVPKHLAWIAVGFAFLIAGARWFLEGAVGIARDFEISEIVIGLTIVAIGGSLPEAATSIVAAIRGHRDIAVGNAVGSNIFNILIVLGVASLVAPGGIPIARSTIYFDFPVMIAVAIACLPIFFTRNVIARWQGAVFVAYYFFYVVYLVLEMSHHDALDAYDDIMLQFVIPLTALTFGVVAFRKLTARNSQSDCD